MGSPEFAVPSLRALAQHHEVVAVYTQPDKPRRRGKELVPTPVKLAAIELGIEVLEPATLRSADQAARLANLAPDVVCVAAYGMILPPEILSIPKLGCINVHASLLPRHRGAAPIHRAILDGDVMAGVSIMLMEEGLDTGPYAATAAVEVDDLGVAELTSLLAEEGARVLLMTLDEIAAGSVSWQVQDDAAATYAAKITDADLVLEPTLALTDALRRVRASSGSARAKLRFAGRSIDILEAGSAAGDPSEDAPASGMLLRGPDSLLVGFSDGVLAARVVRPEGKQVMSGHAFALGARIDSPAPWERA